MDDDRFFEQLYQGVGQAYERVPWAALAPRAALVEWLDHDPPASGSNALVIACGLGDDAEELANRGLKVDAFDYAPTAIAEAQRRFPQSSVDYRVADLFELPQPWNARFQRVVEVQTIQSIPPEQHRAAMAAIAATVAPGGKLFLRTAIRGEDERAPHRPWPLKWSELEWLLEEGLTLSDRLDTHDHDGFVHLVYTRARGQADYARAAASMSDA